MFFLFFGQNKTCNFYETEMSFLETFFILICAILLFALLVLLACGAAIFHIACSRKGRLISKVISTGYKKVYEQYPSIMEGYEKLKKREKREITIDGHDGTPLTAYYIEGQNKERTIICVHGYHSGPIHDFGAATDKLLENANLLLIDQRAHGKSGGKYITFGILESRDCKTWAEWLMREKGADHPVYFDGVSMGATSVLLASALDLPPNVKGIIADCGFSSPKDIFADVTTKVIKINPFLLLKSTDIFCRIFAGFSLYEASTTEAMKTNKLPILFAHGTADSLVPHRMTQSAFDACEAKKYLVLAENAEHGMSYLIDYDRYSSAIQKLFEECEKVA